ncbi:MAG: AmmeMemoRadiSam system protein A [Candidatus Omnitrophica bacterium]|nr:hypothetical protein [bacterium]NUN95608.1 AmmeMemoRadiSam system protein A [Candidatus Omnitrophota bacterium]
MDDLSLDEQRFLLDLARESIRALGRGARMESLEVPPESRLSAPRAAFVTLHKRGKLRGCIGHLGADRPLHQTVAKMAYEAAFHDPRFEPVALEELPDLDVEISVLTPPEPVESEDEIVVGRDGLIVEGEGRRGLLLPQVASSRGWDVATFLEQTCHKAGLDSEAWKRPTVKVYRFTAFVFGEKDLEKPSPDGS